MLIELMSQWGDLYETTLNYQMETLVITVSDAIKNFKCWTSSGVTF